MFRKLIWKVEGLFESQKRWIIVWKRPLISSSPAIHPTPPCLLNHIPKRHSYMVFEHLQGWWLNRLSGQPGPMSDHSFSTEVFPNIQSKPPLMQLEAIASCPIASYLGEETNTRLATTSFQVVVESYKVPAEPPLLQTKRPQLLQVLLVRRVEGLGESFRRLWEYGFQLIFVLIWTANSLSFFWPICSLP